MLQSVQVDWWMALEDCFGQTLNEIRWIFDLYCQCQCSCDLMRKFFNTRGFHTVWSVLVSLPFDPSNILNIHTLTKEFHWCCVISRPAGKTQCVISINRYILITVILYICVYLVNIFSFSEKPENVTKTIILRRWHDVFMKNKICKKIR